MAIVILVAERELGRIVFAAEYEDDVIAVQLVTTQLKLHVDAVWGVIRLTPRYHSICSRSKSHSIARSMVQIT